VLFGTAQSLVGILSRPPQRVAGRGLPGVILLNAGSVHRVGPNRLYVRMARELAAEGFVVLRFDFSGIGDSGIRSDNLPFARSSVAETQQAMDYLAAVRGIERFVLVGICSGAWVSLRTASIDPRVVGAVLINARNHLHDRNDENLGTELERRTLARHYWRMTFSSSFRRKNVLRTLTGGIDYRIIPRVMVASFRSLFASGRRKPTRGNDPLGDMVRLVEHGGRLLHIYSEGDEGLDYFQAIVGRRYLGWHDRGRLELEIIPGASHTFMLRWNQERLLAVTREWILSLAPDQQVQAQYRGVTGYGST
jgi:pimeloyl-ACP methyl ester carboxylesterase